MIKKRYSLLFILILQQIIALGQIKFDFKQDEHDFGVIEEGQNVSFSFKFTNKGKDTIHLKEESRDVRPGCSCTASEFTKTPIAPTDTGSIRAGYNTNGRLGTFNKSITISQKGTPYKILIIKGIVIKKNEIAFNYKSSKFPQLVLSQNNYTFSPSEVGKEFIYSFPIKNQGKDTLKFSEGYSACNCISYSIKLVKTLAPVTYLLPGKMGVIEVKYKIPPFQGMGDSISNDKLTIFTNDPKFPKIELNLSSK